MSKAFKGPAARVTVAVAFDDETPALVKATESLCLVSSMTLRLVHACETPYGTWVGHPFSGLLSGDVIEAAEEAALAEAERKLSDLKKTIDSRVSVTHNVLFGRPAESIVADSIASRASLIVTGTSKAGHRFVLKGFSTALSLISDASVPVLVIPGGVKLDFGRRGIRIMLADDLREDRDDARQAAFALAAACPGTEFLHVHVNPLSEQHLIMLLEGTMARLPRSIARDISPTDLYKKAEEQLAAKLESFGAARQDLVTSSGGRYEKAPLSGDVVESLERKISEWNPDIIVFGRHHMAHRRPFLPGQVPFRTMLSQRRTIMVAPATK